MLLAALPYRVTGFPEPSGEVLAHAAVPQRKHCKNISQPQVRKPPPRVPRWIGPEVAAAVGAAFLFIP